MKKIILMLILAISIPGICFAAGSNASAASAASASGAAARAASGAAGVGNSSPASFAPSVGGGNSVGSGSSSMGVGNATAIGGGYSATGPGNTGGSGYSASGTESYTGPVLVGTPNTASGNTNSVDVNVYQQPNPDGSQGLQTGDSSNTGTHIDSDSAD